MDSKEAQERFQAADELYRQGGFQGALKHLDALDAAFPGNHRVLNAKARTLAQLGRYDESLRLCDRLIDVFGYDKIRPFRDRVAARLAQGKFGQMTPTPSPGQLDSEGDFQVDTVNDAPEQAPKRFKIKPLRLILLILLLLAAWQEYISWYVAGGLIAAYFIIFYGLKFLFGKLLVRLFMIPFMMKGKALKGAAVELHGVEPAAAPAQETPEDEDEQAEQQAKGPLRWAWVDVTISPQPRSSGFTHWEPGELAIAPASRRIRNLDDHDHCFSVHDVKILEDGQELEDEGYKLQGPRRVKLLFGVPEAEREFQFVYYGNAFGRLSL